ncbi:hypothetical protein [Streptomyces acidiscabies]|uniref:hypothetical protein n=1 Tax=Streptomyces acidiscabies TaxID=42234 RepID=UPI0038F64B2B
MQAPAPAAEAYHVPRQVLARRAPQHGRRRVVLQPGRLQHRTGTSPVAAYGSSYPDAAEYP